MSLLIYRGCRELSGGVKGCQGVSGDVRECHGTSGGVRGRQGSYGMKERGNPPELEADPACPHHPSWPGFLEEGGFKDL